MDSYRNFVEQEYYCDLEEDAVFDAGNLLGKAIGNAIDDLRSSKMTWRADAFFWLCCPNSELYQENLKKFHLADINQRMFYSLISKMAESRTERMQKFVTLPEKQIHKAVCVELKNNNFLFFPMFTDGAVDAETAEKIIAIAEINGCPVERIGCLDEVPEELQVKVSYDSNRVGRNPVCRSEMPTMNIQEYVSTLNGTLEPVVSKKGKRIISSAVYFGDTPSIKEPVQVPLFQ